MTNLREAAQMALDALEAHADIGIKAEKQIEALRARLAQPEQEPVAYWRHTSSINQGWDEFGATKAFDDDIPLYTAPPQREWQSLTDEEILKRYDEYVVEQQNVIAFARAIEAKLKEKNA